MARQISHTETAGSVTYETQRAPTAPSRAGRYEGSDLPSTFLACRAPSRRNPERFVCGAKLGEALEDLRFMGVVRRWADRDRATDAPRDVRRCPKCGWYNLYEPAER
jgi:hypothetical protein